MRTNRSDIEMLRLYSQNHDSMITIFRDPLCFELISIHGNFNFQQLNIKLFNPLNIIIIIIDSVQLQFFIKSIYGTYYESINYKCYHFRITLLELQALKRFLRNE